MSYVGNYETALTYLKSGLKERSYEQFVHALDQVPDSAVEAGDPVYVGILAGLGRLSLERQEHETAIRYIQQGLKADGQHPDLLFLRSLYLWDAGAYDEMFVALIEYLASLAVQDNGNAGYEFTGAGAVTEVMQKLLPVAYRNSQNQEPFLAAVKRMSAVTDNDVIRGVAAVLNALEASELPREEHACG